LSAVSSRMGERVQTGKVQTLKLPFSVTNHTGQFGLTISLWVCAGIKGDRYGHRYLV